MFAIIKEINKYNFRNSIEELKKFLTRHDIPGEIVLDFNVSVNAVTIQLAEGSAIKYGDKINLAFNSLPTAYFSYTPMCTDDQIKCWSMLINDVYKSNEECQHNDSISPSF